MKNTEITLFPFPRTYSSLQDVCEKEIEKVTGARNTRLVIHDSHSFGFEDEDNPMNPKMKRICGFVDPKFKVDVRAMEREGAIFIVDEDDTNNRLLIVATNLSSNVLEVIKRSVL